MMRESSASRHMIFIMLSILFAVLFTLLIHLSADAQEAKAVVDIGGDSYEVDVSPEGQGMVEIEVSVRSTVPRNTVYEVHYELVGAPTWTVDIPGKLYMEPLGRKIFDATVIAPIGEPAGKEAELRVWVSGEGETVSWETALSGDSCTIVVEPFHRADIALEEDYLLDRDLEGSVLLPVVNRGNTMSWIGLDIDQGQDRFSIPSGLEQLEPGENRTVVIEYDMRGITESVTVSLFPKANTWSPLEGVDLKFVPDGDIVHILLRRGPFLILVPRPLAEGNVVELFTIGGGLENCGIELVEGPEGAYIDARKGFDLAALRREEIRMDPRGFSGSRSIIVRAYGYDVERKVVSNPWVFRADMPETDEAFVITAPVAVGGGAAAVTAIFAGSAAYFYGASEVFKYRWLTLAFVPLYTIAHEEKVLDHFFRGRLFEYIREHPGATFSALKEHFEVNNGTLTYHLHRLEKEELITYRNLGKYKLFYADGMRIKGVDVVISPLDREIIEMISREPGIASSRIIASFDDERSKRTVSRHLKQLERKRFIRVERSHGARRLYITGDLERVLIPGKGVIEVAKMTGVETL